MCVEKVYCEKSVDARGRIKPGFQGYCQQNDSVDTISFASNPMRSERKSSKF